MQRVAIVAAAPAPVPGTTKKIGKHRCGRKCGLKKAKEELASLAMRFETLRVIIPGCYCYTCQPMIYKRQRQTHRTETDIRRIPHTHALTPQWHSVSSLVPLALQAIDSASRRDPINRVQDFAEKAWLSWWQNGRSEAARQLRSLDLSKSIPDPASFFHKPAQIFNGLFFGGRLPKTVIVWAKLAYGMYGQTCDKGPIELSPTIREHVLQPEAILCTILHEMIHVYLRYTCDGLNEGCNFIYCSLLREENVGCSGHGRAWRQIASAVEHALPAVLGFKGRLGGQETMVEEIRGLGFRPTKCDERTWCADMNDFVERYKLRREFRDDSHVSLRKWPRPMWRPTRRRNSLMHCLNMPEM